MADIYGRNDRFYCAKQTNYYTIRNTGGAASLVAADAAMHLRFSADPARARAAASDKEPNAYRGYIDKTRRARQAAASATLGLKLHSASGAGVQPDVGCVLESIFGQESEVAATSVTYSLLPSGLVTCELWHFNAAKRGKVAFGSLASSFDLSVGRDAADLSVSFLCYNVLTQERFAAAETLEKGGLTSWPTEPASQTYTGAELAGNTVVLTVDGQAYTGFRSARIRGNMARAYRGDKQTNDGSEFMPHDPYEDIPEFLFDFELFSTDAAAIDTLLAKIAARTAVDASLAIGNTAGGTYTWSLNNLIMPDGKEGFIEEDGDDRKVIRVSGLRAQATSTSVRDEIGLVIT